MSDEAFARRFYADRAELLALGVGITSQRDEFTGEELYTLQREDYFLPPLHLDDAELAALQTCLYLLEGQFAYSEPLRLALQNLALGRPNPTGPPADSAVTLNLAGGGYSPEIAQRLAKLETAISKQRTIVFRYFAMNRGAEATRTVDPYSLYFQGGQWYVVGRDHDRDDMRVFRVSRIRGDLRFATRRERDFKFPEGFDPGTYRDRAPWQLGEAQGEAVLDITPSAAWLVERLFGRHGTVEIRDDRGARFATPYASLELLATWVIGMDGQALPVSPPELVDEVATALDRGLPAHEGDVPPIAAPIEIVREQAAEPAAAAALQPGRARALRGAAGDAGRPARELRRRAARRDLGDRPEGALRAHRRRARGAGQPAQPRQLRRRLLRRLRRVRRRHDQGREGAVRRGVPPPRAPLAARGQGDPDGARPGRAAGRRRRGHHARRRAAQGRVGVRALRAPRDADAGRAARGRGHPVGHQRLDPQPPARAGRVPRPQRRRHDRARRRAVPAARRRLRLVPRELRPHRRRRAHVPRRPHPRRRAAARDVRAARRPRGAGRAARAARPLRHRLGVVLARDRRPRDRDPAVTARRSSTAPRWRPSPTAPSAGWRPRSSSTAATPC